MYKRTSFSALVFVVATTISSLAQNTLLVSVDKSICPNARFSSIQDAVNHASPGDTINICPGIYREQVFIDGSPSRITIRGLRVANHDRAVVKPNEIVLEPGFLNAAAILVFGVNDITIDNISVDGVNNGFGAPDCLNFNLNGIFFAAASGMVRNTAVYNIISPEPTCSGNGYGVAGFGLGSDTLVVEHTVVHNYGAAGIFFESGIRGTATGNEVAGRPPVLHSFGSAGIAVIGTSAEITGNQITMGSCLLSAQDCITNLDYGVFLLAADNTVVDHNTISLGQTGIWIDSTNRANIVSNLISNIDTLDGVDFAATISTSTDDQIRNNILRHMSVASKSAAIRATGQGAAIFDNSINDAYAGVLFKRGNRVEKNNYSNTDLVEQVIQ